MAEFVALNPEKLAMLHEQNPQLVSYNVEFAEVTGGTFWKAYTPGQIAGTEPFLIEASTNGIASMYKDLMQVYPPVNLYDEKLRKLTKALGTAWIRVSGTWATKTYYDFDGQYPGNSIPEGYLNKLTRDQWIGVLDFARDCGLKLMVSLANCPGLHTAEEPWPSAEAEKLFGLSKAYGVPIDAAEFTNEPNMMEETGFPKGYTAEHYRRDADLFAAWLKANYPECLYVGPSSTGGDNIAFGKAGGIERLAANTCGCDDLLGGTEQSVDVFSYHYYNGVSERLASVMPEGHWDASEANSEAYLDTAARFCRTYLPFRDKYCPGGEMWVTESGDAGGGGNTWASTYLDVLRTLNELGSFSQLTRGVVFHNTLTASDYGYLSRFTHDPRPNYFAVLLWNRLMGQTVYDVAEPIREGVHMYCHSYRKAADKRCYLIINNSETQTTTIDSPSDGTLYLLCGQNSDKRASVMTLNGRALTLRPDCTLPALSGEPVATGPIQLPPMCCMFLVI